MSKEISLDDIKKFWPEKAPDINIVQKYISKYKNEKIVIKYGGNVLIDRNVFNNFISDINVLNKLGLSIIVVHGGGPRIQRELDKKKIVSKLFVLVFVAIFQICFLRSLIMNVSNSNRGQKEDVS